MTVTASPSRPGRMRAAAQRAAVCAFAGLILAGGPVLARTEGGAPQPRVGHAYSLETGELVYREIHDPRAEDGRLRSDRVEYRGPDGRLLALKEVDYTPNPVAPAFRMEDRRTGYVEGLAWNDAGEPEVFMREEAGAPMERARLGVTEGLVADAGFDVMVYRQLDALQDGAEPVFPFAVPSRLRTLDFRLRSLGRREILGRQATLIRMELANPLLRWLVDPIDVAYNAESGALLRYEGISNLPRPDGDGNYRVRIDFPPEGVEPEPPEPEDRPSNERP
ncbi:MAG: hypothetical protein U5K33_00905 [Halofilum sp. (in: g-proteobacteria)]|nr:hypothetical protein [Halofilum sp. (in: g-proteobacteria)]